MRAWCWYSQGDKEIQLVDTAGGAAPCRERGGALSGGPGGRGAPPAAAERAGGRAARQLSKRWRLGRRGGGINSHLGEADTGGGRIRTGRQRPAPGAAVNGGGGGGAGVARAGLA